MHLHRVLIFFIACGLSSCSVFSPIKTEPANMYVLNSAPTPAIKKSSQKIALYVASVESNSIYNTNSMAYSIRPYQIEYFAKNRWAASPAKMLHPLIVQTLQKTRYFSAVSGSPVGQYDFILDTQLIKLQQQFLPRSSFSHLVLQAKLINASTNQVIAIKEFSMTEMALSNTPYGGVIAANKATSRLLSALAAFCTKNLHKTKKIDQRYYIKIIH